MSRSFCDSLFLKLSVYLPELHSFPTRRSSDLVRSNATPPTRPSAMSPAAIRRIIGGSARADPRRGSSRGRSEEHTSELQSRQYLVCRLLLEKKKQYKKHDNERRLC